MERIGFDLRAGEETDWLCSPGGGWNQLALFREGELGRIGFAPRGGDETDWLCSARESWDELGLIRWFLDEWGG
jgi:hypothetical protein